MGSKGGRGNRGQRKSRNSTARAQTPKSTQEQSRGTNQSSGHGEGRVAQRVRAFEAAALELATTSGFSRGSQKPTNESESSEISGISSDELSSPQGSPAPEPPTPWAKPSNTSTESRTESRTESDGDVSVETIKPPYNVRPLMIRHVTPTSEEPAPTEEKRPEQGQLKSPAIPQAVDGPFSEELTTALSPPNHAGTVAKAPSTPTIGRGPPRPQTVAKSPFTPTPPTKSQPKLSNAMDTSKKSESEADVPDIPPMALGRRVSVSDAVMMDATRHQVVMARPVIVGEKAEGDHTTNKDDNQQGVNDDQVHDAPSAVEPGHQSGSTSQDTQNTQTQSSQSPRSPHNVQAPRERAGSSAQSQSESIKVVKGTTEIQSSGQPSAEMSRRPSQSQDGDDLIIGVCVVGFHHQRGPEVEYWAGPSDQSDVWPYLPFQSLPDGSHQFEENFCYFTLLYDRKTRRAPNPTFDRDDDGHIRAGESDFRDVTTLFAIACSRQVPTSELLQRTPDDEYTRATVQKSVVVIARKPIFGPIKEKLTVVTRSYFAQRNFADRAIIDHLYQNLVHLFSLPLSESDLQVGMNLREFVHNFGNQVLVLFKALLLELKILFYASDTDVLCSTQFALISLVPNLINHLEDCGSPLLSTYETTLSKPTHLRTSDRESLLRFMGLPLQTFAGGGMFSPFVPLQQLDDLRNREMRFGMVGTTNNLFLTSGLDFDILVDIDQARVEFSSSPAALKPLLQLTGPDKTFIDPLVRSVRESWSGQNRWEPRALGYQGSEDFVRHRFEDYVLALLASAKYDAYLDRAPAQVPGPREFPPHPLRDFGATWSDRWLQTNNFRIFNKFTDEELFDIVDPVHVGTAAQGGTRIGRLLGFFRRLPTPVQSIQPSTTQQSSSEQPASPATPATGTQDPSSGGETPLTQSPVRSPAASVKKLAFWKS